MVSEIGLITACSLPAVSFLHGTEVSVFGVVSERCHCGFVDDHCNVVEASTVQCGERVAFRRSEDSLCFGEAHLTGKVSYGASQFWRKKSSALRPGVVQSLGTGSTLVREVLGIAVNLEPEPVSKTNTQLINRSCFATLLSVFRDEFNAALAAQHGVVLEHEWCVGRSERMPLPSPTVARHLPPWSYSAYHAVKACRVRR